MEEKREPLSEMAIERKIQILRNKHMDSEVIALVKSDYEYGLTDDEIGLYLNKSYDIEQMKVLSKCLHKGVSEELLTLLKIAGWQHLRCRQHWITMKKVCRLMQSER